MAGFVGIRTLPIAVMRFFPGAAREGRQDGLLKEAYVIFYGMCFAVIVIGVCAGLLIPLPEEYRFVAWLALPMLVFRSLVQLNQSVNRSGNLMRRYNTIECLHAVLGFGLGLSALYFLGYGPEAIVLGLLSAAVLCSAFDVGLLASPFRRNARALDRVQLVRLVEYAWPLVAVAATAVILQNSGGIPVELHSHCTTGLGPLVALEAVKLGIRIVNTGVPPLADGAALPSIFNVAHNLRASGFKPVIDEDVLRPVTDHFTVIAKREGFPIGVPAEYDFTIYQHQVPGGMISNLGHQLRQVGKEAQLQQALEETGRVRVEFGHPIMVTPLSQFVGSQAAINVILGERYKEVTDQVIRYALGQFGEEAVTAMDQEVRGRILDRPRAREIMAQMRPQPTLADMRRELGGPDVSDEELVLRWLLNRDDIALMRAAGPAKDYVTLKHPLVRLMADLTQHADCDLIQVSKPGFALTLEKSAAP